MEFQKLRGKVTISSVGRHRLNPGGVIKMLIKAGTATSDMSLSGTW